MDYVMGCDIGSQGTKAILLSITGEFAGEAYEGYPIAFPHPFWAEQPVERWLDALIRAVRRLLADTGVSPDRVRALSLATQVDALVLIDSDGQPLHPAMIWMDRRASTQCDHARSRLWNQIKADVTGLPVKVPEITETTALGAAFLALAGIGAYATLSETSEQVVRIRETIDPDLRTQSAYMESYERYRQTYFALLPLFERAANRAG